MRQHVPLRSWSAHSRMAFALGSGWPAASQAGRWPQDSQVSQAQGQAADEQIDPVVEEALGEYHILVILCNFSDLPEAISGQHFGGVWNPLLTPREAEEIIFDRRYPRTWAYQTVNDYYRENSYDRIWLSGQAAGHYTLDIDISVGRPWAELGAEIKAQAIAAAAAEGLDVDLDRWGHLVSERFDRVIFAFPQIPSFLWQGLARGRLIFAANLSANTIAHELGHTFGLRHAGNWRCDDPLRGADDACRSDTYGDVLDLMGTAVSGHFNVAQKYRLGWLDEEQVLAITRGGVYELKPLETAGGVKGLVMAHDPENVYWFEFRRPLGFDELSTAGWPEGALDGITGHRLQGNRTWLLALSSQDEFEAVEDIVLPLGETYVEPNGSFKITPVSIEGRDEEAVLSVDIRLGGELETASQPLDVVTAPPTESVSPEKSPELIYKDDICGSGVVTSAVLLALICGFCTIRQDR